MRVRGRRRGGRTEGASLEREHGLGHARWPCAGGGRGRAVRGSLGFRRDGAGTRREQGASGGVVASASCDARTVNANGRAGGACERSCVARCSPAGAAGGAPSDAAEAAGGAAGEEGVASLRGGKGRRRRRGNKGAGIDGGVQVPRAGGLRYFERRDRVGGSLGSTRAARVDVLGARRARALGASVLARAAWPAGRRQVREERGRGASAGG